MSWNYRVIQITEGSFEREPRFEIHEVYYTSEGKPRAYTADAIPATAETLEGLAWVLRSMAAALELPVLTPADFPGGTTEEA